MGCGLPGPGDRIHSLRELGTVSFFDLERTYSKDLESQELLVVGTSEVTWANSSLSHAAPSRTCLESGCLAPREYPQGRLALSGDGPVHVGVMYVCSV